MQPLRHWNSTYIDTLVKYTSESFPKDHRSLGYNNRLQHGELAGNDVLRRCTINAVKHTASRFESLTSKPMMDQIKPSQLSAFFYSKCNTFPVDLISDRKPRIDQRVASVRKRMQALAISQPKKLDTLRFRCDKKFEEHDISVLPQYMNKIRVCASPSFQATVNSGLCKNKT